MSDITFQNRHIITLSQALILDWVLKVFVTDEELIHVNLKEFQYPLLTYLLAVTPVVILSNP